MWSAVGGFQTCTAAAAVSVLGSAGSGSMISQSSDLIQCFLDFEGLEKEKKKKPHRIVCVCVCERNTSFGVKTNKINKIKKETNKDKKRTSFQVIR